MNKLNAQALANTARGLITLLETNAKATIAGTITEWNTCVKQAEFFGVYDFPTSGYTRKAQLIADLMRCAEQLDDFVEPRADAATLTVEQQTREINATLTRVFDTDEAHAEALEINNIIALRNIAVECMRRVLEGENTRNVISDWNTCCTHAGLRLVRQDLPQRGDTADEVLAGLNLRKTFWKWGSAHEPPVLHWPRVALSAPPGNCRATQSAIRILGN